MSGHCLTQVRACLHGNIYVAVYIYIYIHTHTYSNWCLIYVCYLPLFLSFFFFLNQREHEVHRLGSHVGGGSRRSVGGGGGQWRPALQSIAEVGT